MSHTPPVTVTVIPSGTTASNLGITGGPAWVNFAAVGGPCFIRFGAAGLGASTTSYWPLPEGQKARFLIGPNTTYVSINGAGALHWFAE